MKIINNHQVCNGCKYSSLHYCNYYNEECLSIRLQNQRYQLACLSCQKNDSYTFGLPILCEHQNNNIAYFRLPGLQNLDSIKTFIKMKEYYPEVFYDNRIIMAIYDSFPGTIWNGRQANFQDKNYSVEELITLRDTLEQLNLQLNITWNNHLIEENDLTDKFCNIITEIFHNGKHSITVASPVLFQYLKNNYPNYIYYQSVISNEHNLDNTNNYDMIVLNRKLNNNWNYLNMIPMEKRHTIELLCNDTCTPFCNRLYHYTLDNEYILNRKNPDDYIYDYCSIDHDFTYFNNERWPLTINPNMVDDYLNAGFSHFKLCGRNDPEPIFILKMIQYLVKPQYHMDVFSWAINKIITTEVIYKSSIKGG